MNRTARQKAIRLTHNIRALTSYLHHFSDRKFLVLNPPCLSYDHSGVTVNSVPDLYVEENARKKIIKMDFGTVAPDRRMVNVILQVLLEAATSSGLGIASQDVIYLDVARATQYKGARIRTRLSQDIQAACVNIQALWPGIRRAQLS